jgi:NAD dependent epimerase/dehydratase family enzyme
MNEKLAGPVNLVAPHPVTNDEFTKILARVLKRPAIAPIPQFALKLLLGEMADGLLFSSARVEPKRLREAGYQFHQTELEPTLRSLLSR